VEVVDKETSNAEAFFDAEEGEGWEKEDKVTSV
jgi:hypothetical protein